MNSGADSQGAYQEIAFNYFDAVVREGRIRVYLGSPVVLFTGKYLGASANAAPFPALTSYPQGLYHFSYNGLFAPPAFGYLGAEGPWLFFDSELNAFILSAASNFMTATTSLGAGQEIRSGIKSDISVLPEGFTHQTVLVVEKGINRAFERWGRVITDLQEKRRPSNDADASLAYLGYWTDNGASYYYNFEPALGYSGTLLAIRDNSRAWEFRWDTCNSIASFTLKDRARSGGTLAAAFMSTVPIPACFRGIWQPFNGHSDCR